MSGCVLKLLAIFFVVTKVLKDVPPLLVFTVAALLETLPLHTGWLVIDEIGPLELNGRGFCDVLKEVLSVRRGKILLVVREGMTDQVKEAFVLPHVICISSVSVI